MNEAKPMEVNNDNNKEEEEGTQANSLRRKASELESKLRAEKQRSDLLQSELELSKLILSQEVDKYKRECVCLEVAVARLEEDRSILREREIRDQQRIQNLLDKIEKNEREFGDKLIEVMLGEWDFEYAKKKLHAEVPTPEYGNKSSRPKRKFKLSDSRRTSIARIPGSTGHNNVSDNGVRAYTTWDIKNQSSRSPYKRRNTSSEQLPLTVKKAEEIRSNLNSSNPSFIKPMFPSSVSGGFSLYIPRKFCKENLPAAHELMMILEDEKGLEYKAKFIPKLSMLSGGWIGFAMAHNLGLGDALVFELCEPTRFKIYIIKAIPELSENLEDKVVCEYAEGTSKWASGNRIYTRDVDLTVFNENRKKIDMLTNLDDEQA